MRYASAQPLRLSPTIILKDPSFSSIVEFCFLFFLATVPTLLILVILIVFLTVGSLSINDCSSTAPVPEPIMASSIISWKASRSTMFVLVQLYQPLKFLRSLAQSVPATQNARPEGKQRCCKACSSTSCLSASV